MADVGEIARTFICSRVEFERLFDRHSEQNGALPFKFLALGASGDAEAYEKALAEADAGNWLGRFAHEAIEAGLVDTENASTDAKDALQVELQTLINPEAGFLNPEIMNKGGLQAYGRVCTVLVDDGATAQGTGFLTGPQTVMTAWHVVRSLFGNNGQPTPGADRRLTVKFDCVWSTGNGSGRYAAAEDWLVAFSPCATGEIPDANGAPQPVGQPDPERLDFAIIKLDGLPGRQRGYYVLSPDLWPRDGTRLFVYQHPLNSRQRVDVPNAFFYHDPETRLRLIHTANTLPGSSGGLCVDRDFEPVALHQCGLHEDGQPAGNGAIPTVHIAPHADDAMNSDGQLEQLVSLRGSGHPVIGRTDFQSAVWDLADGSKRILRVFGPTRSGKSFSTRILKSMLPMDQHVILELPAAHVSATDVGVVKQILATVEDPDQAGVPLPSPDASRTSDSAWREEVLLPEFSSRLAAAAGERLVWLVIDGLEHHQLADAGGRRMLEVIYRQIRTMPSLRIVLIGHKGAKVPGANPNVVLHDVLEPLGVLEVAEYLRLWYVRKDIEVNNAEIARLSEVILAAARSRDAERAPAIADFVQTAIVPTLELFEEE